MSAPSTTAPARRAQISRLPYLPGLDGMRAIAVVAVMIYHANSSWLHGGFLGVEVFFVISGYLITLLLIAEHERDGRVRLGQFWLRRFRRLLPALFVMLIGLSVYLAVFFRRPLGQVRGDILGGLSYGSNWYQIWVGQGYTADNKFVPLRHLWSLAVEEQFYLVWPVVMIGLLSLGRHRLPRLALWLGGLAVAITVVVGLLFHAGDVDSECTSNAAGYWQVAGRCISINDTLYLGTFSRAGGLLWGAAMAMVWRPLAIMRGPLRNRSGRLDLIGVLGLAGLVVLFIELRLSEGGREFGSRFDARLFRGGFLLVGLLTLMMIAGVTHRRSLLAKLLSNPLFRWVGTRSYGLYLYHWPIYQIIRREAGSVLTFRQMVVALTIAAVVTECSYRFVEVPIRQGRLGAWMRGGAARPRTAVVARRRQHGLVMAASAAALVGFAGVSIAVADNVCVNDVECSLQQTLDLDELVPPTAPPPTPTTASGTTMPGETTVAPPTTVPGETTVPGQTTVPAPTTPTPTAPGTFSPGPIAFGESVMLGAQQLLWADGGGIWVDAVQSRGGASTAEAIARQQAQGLVGNTVIIQVGTNGSVSDASFDAIMALLPPTTKVYFLTVYAPRGWIADNNTRIRQLPQRYPNVTIIDWEALAATLKLCDDRIHIACGTGAARAYTNMIFSAIGRPDLVK